MRKITDILLLVVTALVAFTATAVASGTVAPEGESILDLARPVFDAVMSGNGWLAAALAVIMVTAATRRYLPDSLGGKFARGDVGGMISAFVISFAGALATTFATPGAAMTGGVLLAALKIGGLAIGGFVALHKLAVAMAGTKWFQEKAPVWLRSGVALVLALIGSSAISRAEAAGKKAVEAAPGAGVDGIVGPGKGV